MAEDAGAEKSIEMWKIKRARPRRKQAARVAAFRSCGLPTRKPPLRPVPALTGARRVPYRS
jgi:hypothetical protein